MIAFRDTLVTLEPKTFHHGDCIGADSQAHNIVLFEEIPIYIFILLLILESEHFVKVLLIHIPHKIIF